MSTQASGHPPFGAAARQLLRERREPAAVLERLMADDPNRDVRQIHVIDAKGRIAAHNGAAITGASGHRSAEDISVAGNMLAGTEVLDVSLNAYTASSAPLAERLLLALEAGHAAGGDKRGQQASALLIHGAQPFPLVSLRVDDSPTAVADLRRLHTAAATEYIPYMRRFASPAEIEGVFGP